MILPGDLAGRLVQLLRELRFDGIATACVFAWEERARESSVFMLEQIRGRLMTEARTAADGALAAARRERQT